MQTHTHDLQSVLTTVLLHAAQAHKRATMYAAQVEQAPKTGEKAGQTEVCRTFFSSEFENSLRKTQVAAEKWRDEHCPNGVVRVAPIPCR